MFGNGKVIGWLMASCIALILAASAAGAGIEDHITKTETGFYYTVQKGDTLWDLSEKFADSPWTWPQIWHYNPEIANPNWIYPGQKILVFEKSWMEEKKAEKAVEKPPVQTFHYEMIDSVGFIRKPAVTPCGTIFKVENQKALVSERDRVYIRKGEGPLLAEGQLYTVYRTFQTDSKGYKKEYGPQHFLTGVVVITEVQPEFAVGNIVKAFRDIHSHDMLMPLVTRVPDIEIKESVRGLSARIIRAENRNVLIGQYELVFINQGENVGISKGQYYTIFRHPLGQPGKHEKPIKLTPVPIGRALVLHAEDETATCLITTSTEPINPGDKIHTPL
jgi:hypothetical protein